MKNRREIYDKLDKDGLLCAMLLMNVGRVDKYSPNEKDAFDRNVAYTRTTFGPVVEHIVFYTDVCNIANSTLPLTFEIADMMHNDGSPAPELEEFYPVHVRKKPYLGTKKSIDEINVKRGIEYRRLFDVRKDSGEIVMWGGANSGVLRCQPDSDYVFNMNISNSDGHKVVKRTRLMLRRGVDFESSIYDSQTGLAITEYASPEISRMRYEQNGSSFFYIIEPEDIHVYLRENKDEQDGATSLSTSFYNLSWNVIDPRRFNETNWGGLFQAGLLKGKIGPKKVVYDMAYPLPLFNGQIKYIDSKGKKVSVKFVTSWFSKYGYRNIGYFVFDFAICKEAHWEMLIHFAKGMSQLGEIKD